MSIDAPWWVFGDVIIASERELPGVYEFGNAAGEVIYIGGSVNICRRLREHWVASSDSCVKSHATQYRVEYRSDYLARERELYDLYVKRYSKPPLCGGEADAGHPAPAAPR